MQIVTGPCDFQADLNGESYPFNLSQHSRHTKGCEAKRVSVTATIRVSMDLSSVPITGKDEGTIILS
jgi:hypothetical protein